MHSPGFHDRYEAGRALGEALARHGVARPIVVGLTRGGVPVASEVARVLRAPLDICIVRKVVAPPQPEFALGAVAEGGVAVLDGENVAAVGASREELDRLVLQKLDEVESRVRIYRKGRAPLDLHGRVVIIVDDGLATGSTARAAIQSVRARGAQRIVLAVPVAAAEMLHALRSEVDELVCLFAPRDFRAVGLWYGDFRPIADSEVRDLLAASPAPAGPLTSARAAEPG